MIYLLTFAFCLPSAVFMFMNAETWVITNSLLKTGEPVLLGAVAATAQIICYAVVYFQGPRLLEMWPKMRAKLATYDASKYATWSYGALFFGATVGLPPTLFFTFLRRQLGFRFPIYIVLVAVARMIRFITLASIPETFRRFFGA